MFQFFSNALDTQNEELKLLHNKVTELERVNNEVLDFVHKNGRLPEIITDRENLELASDQDDISVYRGSESNHGGEHRQLETVTRRSPNSSVLTGVISKDTEELSRELMSLGLESSKCNHIVDHVQENMDNLVSTDTTAYESQLDFDKKTTCLTPQRGISSPIFEIIDLSDHNASPTNPECSGDDSNKSQNYGQPQYSFLPTISTVTYELRRRELLRANQRIVSNSSYSLNDSIESLTDHISYHQSIPSSLSVQLPSSECQAICIPCNNHSLHYSNSNSNPTMSLTDSVLRYCVSEKSNTDETNPNDYSLSCPCGNPQSCPLSEQKIERLCKNPCIIHGFTILSAVFRGRLIRQLLATPKVHDLIRSVKDIAKLILSIKLENQLISMNKLNKQLCNKKLFFELNLLIKLYNILNEIHEIFFIWSIKQQISLISISSNVITKINNCSITKLMNPISNNSLHILRQLQPHQVNSLPKNKQISNNVNGEEKKLNNSIIPNKQIKFPAKNQFIQNENKLQIKNHSKFKTKFYPIKFMININGNFFINNNLISIINILSNQFQLILLLIINYRIPIIDQLIK
uniref:Rac guanyl-nucleotide exchange factor n=1 Tax=Schistosoma mansoni TaxID=6183 RepID=A0A5K4FBI8_SCHMA